MTKVHKKGIVYVATRKLHFIVEAFLSAHSAKEMYPGINITLFTDMTKTPYAKSDCFDNVVDIKTKRSYTSLWAEGQLDRIKCLSRSPYEYTLHLDTDTRVITTDIQALFDKLDSVEIAMSVCEPDASVCSSESGLAMFNVGVILFKKSDKTKKLLAAWRDLTQKHFEIATSGDPDTVAYLSHIDDIELKKRLLFMDQTSMVQLLSPVSNTCDLSFEILDEGWNFRGAFGGRVLKDKLKISHNPVLRNSLGPDAVNVAVQYHKKGKIPYARSIYNNILKEFPLDENEMSVLKNLVQSTYN